MSFVAIVAFFRVVHLCGVGSKNESDILLAKPILAVYIEEALKPPLRPGSEIITKAEWKFDVMLAYPRVISSGLFIFIPHHPLSAEKKIRVALSTMSCDIEATMFYYKARDGVLPAINDIELLLGDKDADGRQVLVRDIRGEECNYSLDKNGFQVMKHSVQTEAFQDPETIKSIYYPAIVKLLKERFVLHTHHAWSQR
jgi:hypothetical protein